METIIPNTEIAIPKLEIENLQKSTRAALVMDEVTITVHAGEIFALIGNAASCKSLISKIIVNLVKKTEGEVKIAGESHKNLKVCARKIGMFLEQQNFYPCKTAYKTLEQHALSHHYPISHAKLVNTLNLVDLKQSMHNTLDRLDTSSLTRLKIAVALYAQPEVIVLDEPFKNLSDEEARKIRIIIKTIADTKKSAVFLTARNIADAEEICDTVGIIDDGFIVTIKSYNQFIRDDAPYDKVRVMTQTPNYAAKTIEEDLKYVTHLCGEWVIVDTAPKNAQSIADALIHRGIKVLSVQRVNRSLQEQFYEIISARRPRPVFGGAS